MSQLSYSDAKSKAFRVISILAVITIFEVLLALLGKGYLISGVHLPWWIMGLVMITLSLYKAYLIVYEFMHMKYEVPGLVRTVLVPTLLLVWAIIAFFQEGRTWKRYRAEANAVEHRIEPAQTNNKAADINMHRNQQEDHGHDDGHGH